MSNEKAETTQPKVFTEVSRLKVTVSAAHRNALEHVAFTYGTPVATQAALIVAHYIENNLPVILRYGGVMVDPDAVDPNSVG